MKTAITASFIAIASITGAFAQTAVITTGTAPAEISIEPEYRTRINTYVTEHRVEPVTTREKIVVGATLPEDVALRTVPTEWGPSLTRYRYIYSNNHVMLVEPSSRRVVRVVD